ncbi:hypothetical protein [Arthrobacter crystallopoietes]|uniref:hypothetical protein n=1 Tax=Crystallibacter crystallopoietes TaxID=37928 RepID=UPI001ABE184D|nr:hypothetical protein [Arthrobacter crystallopoietes]QTG80502.1 hypothetical protein J5251_16975 [Arthrobacter crystallopoietes]
METVRRLELAPLLVKILGAVIATMAVFLFVRNQVVLSLVAASVFLLIVIVGHRALKHRRIKNSYGLGQEEESTIGVPQPPGKKTNRSRAEVQYQLIDFFAGLLGIAAVALFVKDQMIWGFAAGVICFSLFSVGHPAAPAQPGRGSPGGQGRMGPITRRRPDP